MITDSPGSSGLTRVRSVERRQVTSLRASMPSLRASLKSGVWLVGKQTNSDCRIPMASSMVGRFKWGLTLSLMMLMRIKMVMA